jgi:hypothetical protein
VEQALGAEIVGVGVAGALAGETRMPQPALVPWLADLTICSSTPSEVEVTDSK